MDKLDQIKALCNRAIGVLESDGEFHAEDLADQILAICASTVNGPVNAAAGRGGRWEKLGQVGVDSASMGITDILRNDETDVVMERAPRNSVYAVPGSRFACDWGTGIRFWAGFGDGCYDAWGWIADYGDVDETDERVAQVVVTMIDADKLARWRED